ncbi:SNF2-like protein [Burkholderiales bacterium GJ-E10]|nr:SNF2-like protein [Burkholderiales bacterium GJ-E10]
MIRFVDPLEDASVEGLNALAGQSAKKEDELLVAYLAQLAIEERCSIAPDGVTILWSTIYDLQEDDSHQDVLHQLGLPAAGALRPVLDSSDTLADSTFEILVDGWAVDGTEVRVLRIDGAIAVLQDQSWLLGRSAWACYQAIKKFADRDADHRTQNENELGWGSIRQLADAAGAYYRSPYLETTYVLTPQSIRLPLQKQETSFGRVVTVEPTFEGAPSGWLKAFDGFNSVQPHYDLTSSGLGHVRVVVSEPVRKVLNVIKQEMPGRRVAGARAERFIHNPWAFLGDAAREVIKEEEFEEDRAGIGAIAAIFSIAPRIDNSRVTQVDLLITEHFHGGAARTERESFSTPAELQRFVQSIKSALEDERPRFPWNEYDLTVDGNSASTLELAQQMLCLWENQPQEIISFEDIYEIAGYSNRIEGIGVAKAIYVPVFQKETDDEETGWTPSDLTPMVKVTLTGHEGSVLIPLTREWVDKFQEQVAAAESTKAAEVRNESLPTPVETTQARALVDAFRTMLDGQEDIKKDRPRTPSKDSPKPEKILVKMNFSDIDYREERRLTLALPSEASPSLPKCLRPAIELKKHQLNGVAWFQHLVSRAPIDCRGALLADDMGLGKTLQLLTVLGSYYERHPNASPSLILAPKSLVDNWAGETEKFFTESYPKVLVLYGDELRKRKQPQSLIDERLRQRGIVDLLIPDWPGSAKIVITTYETLVNFEFSLARQPFAFVVCDEAQRIKTPGTQTSIAVRALKADFRIACTGTPVENTLSDLWSLFDFVQPGLLGSLEEFSRTYRRPIECNTEEQKAALKQLQEAIAPQTLRRTKQDISDELPRKYFAYRAGEDITPEFKERLDQGDRLLVPMSSYQNVLYLGGLKKLRDANQESDSIKRARLSFGALHLMKAVCAEPYCLPGMKFEIAKSGYETHLENSPKLAWLLKQLSQIKAREEKAIIFTELREVQLALFHFLKEEFGLKPFVINGDSQNRQRYIDRFSESPGFDVIILSTLAAGAGLNVTAANHVFHFTRAWNPAKENQATDRAYRIGQKKDVFVYCPIVATPDYPTFDVRLDELLKAKDKLANSTIDGSEMEVMLNGSGSDISKSELFAAEDGAEPQRRFLTMDDVDRMDGTRFEIFCRFLWEREGYLASITKKRGGDGGIDIVALKGRNGELLQCKSSLSDGLGWDAIKEVTAGSARYQAQHPGTLFRRIAVTNQTFTKGARSQAEANSVFLVERNRLEELLGKYPVDNFEFDLEVDRWIAWFQ